MKKQYFFSGLIALLVSLSSIFLINYWYQPERTVRIEHVQSNNGTQALYSLNQDGQPVKLDFNETAKRVLDGVVHIKSTQMYSANRREQPVPAPFRDFFGEEFEYFFGPKSHQFPRNRAEPPVSIGTGSGVIISEDGYIVTNNHVIANADDIEVTLHDNRSYKATVIGTDPSTDLALLQIKEKDLPTVPFVNSEEVQIGQWVLAVGNPLGLNSTVTAGIVSAKGRSINILRDKYAVENFIQTDAAINPGNSGGALVDLNGGLVGINTAIASPTGSYAGYGFAVPANIVQKVVTDLLEYGTVQRGVLGVMIRTIDGNFAREKGLEMSQGVYIDSLLENSAAKQAGILPGDVVLGVDNVPVKSSPELQGIIAQHRPGEKITLTINRNGKEMDLKVVLNNRDGNTNPVTKTDNPVLKILGASFETIDAETAKKLDIKGGVRVKALYPGKITKYTQMREGFIITKVDGRVVRDAEKLIETLSKKKGGVMLEGIYEDIPGEYYYAFGL